MGSRASQVKAVFVAMPVQTAGLGRGDVEAGKGGESKLGLEGKELLQLLLGVLVPVDQRPEPDPDVRGPRGLRQEELEALGQQPDADIFKDCPVVPSNLGGEDDVVVGYVQVVEGIGGQLLGETQDLVHVGKLQEVEELLRTLNPDLLQLPLPVLWILVAIRVPR